MRFSKLDSMKEQSVVTAIEKIIDNSQHNPDTDLNKIAAEVLGSSDMSPELARRACEAYNKSKSVFILQKRATEDRAEDFPLIDPAEVNRLMYGYHEKEAVALEMPARTHTDNIPELRKKLEKVAFDPSEAPPLADIGIIEREIHRTTVRLSYGLESLRSTAGMHKQSSEDAIHRACQVMRRLNKKALHKVARMIVNRYDENGVRLVKLIGAYIDKDMPIKKTANAAIFPLREPYTSIAIAIDEARAFATTDGLLKKTAGPVTDAGIGVGRQAKTSIKRLLDPALNFAKSPVYSQITKEHKVRDDETFDATLRNRLQQLRATQAFVDIAADDFIKDYPIDDTVKAYNNVVGSVPELLDEKYTSWLQALVREQLVQGNVQDPNTIQQLQAIGKEIKQGKIQDIDMATKQLEAGKGGTRPGLSIESKEVSKPAPSSEKTEKPRDTKLEAEKLRQQGDLAERQNQLKDRELALKDRELTLKEQQANKPQSTGKKTL